MSFALCLSFSLWYQAVFVSEPSWLIRCESQESALELLLLSLFCGVLMVARSIFLSALYGVTDLPLKAP